MTQKVNGAAYPGAWVEKNVAFVKLTFNVDISQITETHLYLLGTTTAVSSGNTGTVADSTFGIVESAIVKALKVLETNATVLAVSAYNVAQKSVDVMIGYAGAWFSDTNGSIATGIAVGTTSDMATASVTTAGSAVTNAPLAALVSVNPAYVTFNLSFAYVDGNMTTATYALGALDSIADGVGAGTAAAPMGAAGFYPTDPYTA